MPVVNNDRNTGPSLFVLKRTETSYRMVFMAVSDVMQTYHSVLMWKFVADMHTEGGDVDNNNFFLWSQLLVEHIRDLCAGGRKVLFIYYGYRLHLPVRFLKLLLEIKFAVYALPAQTSGKTQPCNVVLFDVYKRALDSLGNVVGSFGDKIALKIGDTKG